MKKLLFILAACITLTSCENRAYEEGYNEETQSKRLVFFERHIAYDLCFDKETGVEYCMSRGNVYFITPLLDEYGNPKLHKGYSR